MKYCEPIFKTQRWKTREVLVGNVGVGGDHPIRIQSMTTSNTRDAQATIEYVLILSVLVTIAILLIRDLIRPVMARLSCQQPLV